MRDWIREHNFSKVSRLKAFLRYFTVCLISCILKFFWIFPLKKERILVYSFDGLQYSDNPKYLAQLIRQTNPCKKIIWAFYDVNKFLYLREYGYEIIPRKSFRFLFEMVTAGTIINNSGISNIYPIRKRQVSLNTWHGGSPLKTVGFAESKSNAYQYYFFKLQNKKYTAFLSSSRFMTEDVFKKSFNFTGKILEFGMPRNALLLSEHDEIIDKVYNHYGIKRDKNSAIVLYAPTFRGDYSESYFISSDMQFDIDKCIDALNKKFGKKFTFLFRAHHAMKDVIQGNNVISASEYPDMQELLCAADVLITDYSSCMGDMCLMKKPVFLYTPDLDEYTKDRGFYWDIYSLPYPISLNKKQFYESIANFEQNRYENGVAKYLERLGSVESPHSAEKAVSWLEEQWNNF